jgi:hypothetical protein
MKTNTRPLLIAFLIVCLGLSEKGLAVNPAPDGGYPGGNTAEGGSGALFSLTSGTNNTALGSQALFSLTTGIQNTATGAQALKNNWSSNNTADGFQALVNNTSGYDNTATGWRALFRNTNGEGNTATGDSALYSNTAGSENTANGVGALSSNTTGRENTAIGSAALLFNTTGSVNTAVGLAALINNNSGRFNIALGFDVGSGMATGDYNIYIGSNAPAVESNTIHIGQQFLYHTFGFDHPAHTATFIAGISGTIVTGTPVVINEEGQLGVSSSSERFKQDIKPMDRASEALLTLRPVTFRYKPELDPKGIPQFGLVAEDVEKVNPDLVARDAHGKVYTVRYEAVNAMLLNEFLKEHRKVEDLEKKMAALAAQLKEQAAQIQKVSAHLEMTKPTTNVVLNNP